MMDGSAARTPWRYEGTLIDERLEEGIWSYWAGRIYDSEGHVVCEVECGYEEDAALIAAAPEMAERIAELEKQLEEEQDRAEYFLNRLAERDKRITELEAQLSIETPQASLARINKDLGLDKSEQETAQANTYSHTKKEN
jgi:hypothetical protein